MTELEDKNLKAQIKLQDDIIKADRMIIYQITARANEILTIFNSKYNISSKVEFPLTFTQKEYEELFPMLSEIAYEDSLDKVGSLKSYIEEKKNKTEILKLLN